MLWQNDRNQGKPFAYIRTYQPTLVIAIFHIIHGKVQTWFFRKRGPSSPAPDSPSYKRQTLSPEYSNALPPRRRSAWTEAVLCKFFREGHCRDGENCVYSHNAADSNRKPELCKYYQQGYCKKGLACNLLHGEYPCKAFHIGKCDKNPCKYSHVQLNDYTRPLYEQVCCLTLNQIIYILIFYVF